LVFCDFAFFFNVEAADKEVPFSLEACGSRDTYLCCWRWREAFDACYADEVFGGLLHFQIADVGGYVAIVVKRPLNLVEQL
jgi:hypothetical protein